jgi:hypothetical protein
VGASRLRVKRIAQYEDARGQDMALCVLNWVVRFKFRPVQTYRKEASFPTIIHCTD